jgi:hypothetical protein
VGCFASAQEVECHAERMALFFFFFFFSGIQSNNPPTLFQCPALLPPNDVHSRVEEEGKIIEGKIRRK